MQTSIRAEHYLLRQSNSSFGSFLLWEWIFGLYIKSNIYNTPVEQSFMNTLVAQTHPLLQHFGLYLPDAAPCAALPTKPVSTVRFLGISPNTRFYKVITPSLKAAQRNHQPHKSCWFCVCFPGNVRLAIYAISGFFTQQRTSTGVVLSPFVSTSRFLSPNEQIPIPPLSGTVSPAVQEASGDFDIRVTKSNKTHIFYKTVLL